VALYNEAMAGVAATCDGVHLHDLHSVAVEAAAGASGLGEDGVHWSEAGARTLGEAVAAYLWTHNCSWPAAV
jgi:lysophospholipase L1-like esterase